jgi:hypothetical protein
MTDGLASVITLLEQQRTAIDRALVALREVGEVAAPAKATPPPPATPEVSGRKGKRRSVAVRKRMQEAQRAPWARIKEESEQPAPVTTEAPKPKRKISAEGIKRIVQATKRRWARVRAEAKAALESAETKKAVPAKAVKKSTPVKKTAPVKKMTAVTKASSVKTVAKKKSAKKKVPVPAPTAAVETPTKQV